MFLRMVAATILGGLFLVITQNYLDQANLSRACHGFELDDRVWCGGARPINELRHDALQHHRTATSIGDQPNVIIQIGW